MLKTGLTYVTTSTRTPMEIFPLTEVCVVHCKASIDPNLSTNSCIENRIVQYYASGNTPGDFDIAAAVKLWYEEIGM